MRPDRTRPLGDGVDGLLAAGAAVAGLGLVADVWRLKTRFLVLGTAVAAACVVPYGELGVPGGALAVVWIVFVAGAFKGLDHADGLAGTIGVVTAFGVGACAAMEVMDGLAVLLSVLAAALTGFLMHNWHPARIALGACGSLFTGFLLASAAVLTQAGRGPGEGAGVLFALTAVASADAVLVLLSRRLAGRALLRGGPDHLAYRLRRLGLTRRGRWSWWRSEGSPECSSGCSCTTGGRTDPPSCGWWAGPLSSCSGCLKSLSTGDGVPRRRRSGPSCV